MRTVHVDVTVHMVLKLDEGVEVSDFISEMDYEFHAPETGGGTIEDTEIRDHEVKDSR
jgi:hypothetical protein